MGARQRTPSIELLAKPPAAANVLRRKFACGNQSSGGGTCEECRKKEDGDVLRRHATTASSPGQAPPIVDSVLSSPGQPLDAGARAFFEPRFRRDFSNVRLHADAQAAASARAVDAAAYAVGNSIVLDSAHRDAQGSRRNALLAHELAHVEQTASASVPASGISVGAADAPEEHAADARAHAVLRGDASSAPTGFSEARALRLRRAPPDTVDAAMCEANQNPNPARIGSCSYKEPENCATYEAWVSTFTLLKTFRAQDSPGAHHENFHPIGGDIADPTFTKPGNPAKPAPQGTPLKPGEEFIDHPTDEWVKTCLPANLRATAYQLPADCADVAIILRHVWLAAHKRTEQFGKWTLGDAAGKDNAQGVHQVIAAEGTGTVAGMVNPYSAPDGSPLRSFTALEPLLHPGDILVWWHFKDTDTTFQGPRTGGHTHTIARVFREPTGKLTGLQLLQGNEPLFEGEKQDIHDFLGKKKDKPDFKTLGEAPGRRVERETSSDSGLTLDKSADVNVKAGKNTIPIWKWGTDTLLVAAGPPRAAARPAAQVQKGQKGPALRALTDWLAPIRQSGAANFAGTVEAMLYELRAIVEAGSSVPKADVDALGAAIGTKAQALDGKSGKAAAGEAVSTNYLNVRAIIREFTDSRDIATSRKLDSAYDVVTTMLLRHLYWLRDAIDAAVGAKP